MRGLELPELVTVISEKKDISHVVIHVVYIYVLWVTCTVHARTKGEESSNDIQHNLLATHTFRYTIRQESSNDIQYNLVATHTYRYTVRVLLLKYNTT